MSAPAPGRPTGVSTDVQAYVDSIAPEHRAVFDRVRATILAVRPEATVRLSYGMPTYEAGGRRLYVGVWCHGISLYGCSPGEDGGFADRHPELVSGRGTIRLRPADATALADDELTGLVRAALGG